MSVFYRATVAIVAAVLLGAGCSGAQKPVVPPASGNPDPSQLNLPGVPYGTLKQAETDIKNAADIEQKRQQETQ
jgi:hypothetical protein